MAGNIIPAIATTNAVIAGLIIMEALKILSGRIKACKTVSIQIVKMWWWGGNSMWDLTKFGWSCPYT